MYFMDYERPSYRTFGYFISEVLADSIEDIFNEINQANLSAKIPVYNKNDELVKRHVEDFGRELDFFKK